MEDLQIRIGSDEDLDIFLSVGMKEEKGMEKPHGKGY